MSLSPPIVEVPKGSNVTVDVTSEQAMEIDAVVNDAQPNGVVVEQQQAQATVQQLPPLFDMDLERMYSELFSRRLAFRNSILNLGSSVNGWRSEKDREEKGKRKKGRRENSNSKPPPRSRLDEVRGPMDWNPNTLLRIQ